MGLPYYNFCLVFCLLFPCAYCKSLPCSDGNQQLCLMEQLLAKSGIPVRLKVENGWQMYNSSPNMENNANILWKNWTTLDSLGDEYCLKTCLSTNDGADNALPRCVKQCSSRNCTVSISTENGIEKSMNCVDLNENSELGTETDEDNLESEEKQKNRPICINFKTIYNVLRKYEKNNPKPLNMCCKSAQHLRYMVQFLAFYQAKYGDRILIPDADIVCIEGDVLPLLIRYNRNRYSQTLKGTYCTCDNYVYLRNFADWYKGVTINNYEDDENGEKGQRSIIRKIERDDFRDMHSDDQSTDDNEDEY